jgi:hypothetical protein
VATWVFQLVDEWPGFTKFRSPLVSIQAPV